MGKTHFIWDELSDNVLMETDELGAVQAEYTQEPQLYGSVVSQKRGNDTSYYHFDGQGSTRELTDENQNVTDTATYTAFGEEIAKTGSTVNPWGYKGALGYYAGESPDDDLYVRERQLAPSLGRWLSDIAPLSDCGNSYPADGNNPQYPLPSPIGTPPIIGRHGPGNRWRPTRSDVAFSLLPNPKASPKCRVTLVCNRIGFIFRFKHCGVQVTGCGEGVEFHAGHKKNLISKECTLGSYPPGTSLGEFGGWVAERWGFSNCQTCNCIKRTAKKMEKVKFDYQTPPGNYTCAGQGTHFGCNSSYIAKCLLRNCGIDVSRGAIGNWGVFGTPVGWEHRIRRCERSTRTHGPRGCICTCHEWKTLDSSWCGA